MRECIASKYKVPGIRLLAEYITGNTVEEKGNPDKYKKCKDLIKLIEIYESDLSLYGRLSKMREVFSTLFRLKTKLGTILDYENDPILGQYITKWKEICDFYAKCDETGITQDVDYLNQRSSYFYCYDYAKFVIYSYISSSESFDTKRFLDELGIDRAVFDYCIEAIDELDPDLYKKYSSKSEENKNIRITSTKNKINEIVNGIKTGFLADGRPFDAIEFLKRLPFYDKESGRETLSDFDISLFAKPDFNTKMRALATKIAPNDAELFLRYMHDNRIDNATVLPINLKEIYETRCFINGREITQNEIELLLCYMKEQKIPMIQRGLSITRDKYLNGEITIKDVKIKKYVPRYNCTIIPRINNN